MAAVHRRIIINVSRTEKKNKMPGASDASRLASPFLIFALRVGVVVVIRRRRRTRSLMVNK